MGLPLCTGFPRELSPLRTGRFSRCSSHRFAADKKCIWMHVDTTILLRSKDDRGGKRSSGTSTAVCWNNGVTTQLQHFGRPCDFIIAMFVYVWQSMNCHCRCCKHCSGLRTNDILTVVLIHILYCQTWSDSVSISNWFHEYVCICTAHRTA